jgi:hypothetical protein
MGLAYVLAKLSDQDVQKRIIENLKIGVEDNNVLKNHAQYLIDHKINEGFPLILKELINTDRNEYARRDLLNLYFPASDDKEGLKSVLPKADDFIKWEIVEKLSDGSEKEFILLFLLDTLHNNPLRREKFNAAKYLIRMEHLEGLQYLIDCFKGGELIDLTFQNPGMIASLKKKESVPLLMELLELGYQRDFSIDRFENLQSYAIGALYNLALLNEENYLEVMKNLERFIEKNTIVYPDVKFINFTIDRLRAQYNMNRAQLYTIPQVLNKLKILEQS